MCILRVQTGGTSLLTAGGWFGMGVTFITCLACWRSHPCNQTGHPSFSSQRCKGADAAEHIVALHGQVGLKGSQVMSLLGMMLQILLPGKLRLVYVHVQDPAAEVGIPVPGCSIREAAR